MSLIYDLIFFRATMVCLLWGLFSKSWWGGGCGQAVQCHLARWGGGDCGLLLRHIEWTQAPSDMMGEEGDSMVLCLASGVWNILNLGNRKTLWRERETLAWPRSCSFCVHHLQTLTERLSSHSPMLQVELATLRMLSSIHCHGCLAGVEAPVPGVGGRRDRQVGSHCRGQGDWALHPLLHGHQEEEIRGYHGEVQCL